MTKKLKNLCYKSKKDFMDDLYLIYDNCFLYNTDPSSVYRVHAAAMRVKSDELAKDIPDVTIRDKEEMEEDEDSDYAEGSVKQHSRRPTVAALVVNHSLSSSPPPFLEEKVVQVVQADVQTDMWRRNTAHERAKQYASRKLRLKTPLEQHEALLRTQQGMRQFNYALSCHDQPLQGRIHYMPEYDVSNGCPDTSPPPPTFDTKSMNDYVNTRPVETGTAYRIQRNIQELQRIQKLHTKIASIKAGQFTHSHANGVIPPPPPTTEYLDHLLNEPSALAVLKHVVAKLLLHIGFQGAEEGALVMLTEFAANHLFSIGCTLNTYTQKYHGTLDNETILLTSLVQNGIPHLSALHEYVQEDFKHGKRLHDLHKRLKHTLDTITMGKTLKTEGDVLNDDQMARGTLLEALGEDYFGLNELGLQGVRIPEALWRGRSTTVPIAKSVKNAAGHYDPPPPFAPIVSTGGIIGLLQGYFSTKLVDVHHQPLVEDEHLVKPKRPKSIKTLGTKRKKVEEDD